MKEYSTLGNPWHEVRETLFRRHHYGGDPLVGALGLRRDPHRQQVFCVLVDLLAHCYANDTPSYWFQETREFGGGPCRLMPKKPGGKSFDVEKSPLNKKGNEKSLRKLYVAVDSWAARACAEIKVMVAAQKALLLQSSSWTDWKNRAVSDPLVETFLEVLQAGDEEFQAFQQSGFMDRMLSFLVALERLGRHRRFALRYIMLAAAIIGQDLYFAKADDWRDTLLNQRLTDGVKDTLKGDHKLELVLTFNEIRQFNRLYPLEAPGLRIKLSLYIWVLFVFEKSTPPANAKQLKSQPGFHGRPQLVQDQANAWDVDTEAVEPTWEFARLNDFTKRGPGFRLAFFQALDAPHRKLSHDGELGDYGDIKRFAAFFLSNLITKPGKKDKENRADWRWKEHVLSAFLRRENASYRRALLSGSHQPTEFQRSVAEFT